MPKRGQAVLERVPLFDGLSKGQLRQIRDLTNEVRYMENASIVKENEPGDSFYVIIEGQAKVQRNGRSLAKLVPGARRPRRATVASRRSPQPRSPDC